jgi:hypothetical protein
MNFNKSKKSFGLSFANSTNLFLSKNKFTPYIAFNLTYFLLDYVLSNKKIY